MPRTWIFQANPNRFNIDAYVAARPSENEWLVTRFKDQITPGDRVYLWRAGGKEKGQAGVFAEARVITPVRPITDDGPADWWTDPADAAIPANRVRIALVRVANKKNTLKREWFVVDPIMRGHPIVTIPNATNFSLEGPACERVDRLWAKTGTDWSYEETVAGLYAYVITSDGPISRLPTSKVAEIAVTIGRPVTGLYNKIMNFRAIDPTDMRAGLPGTSNADRTIWPMFARPDGSIDAQAVTAEYVRLWTEVSERPDFHIDLKHAHAEAAKLSRSSDLAALMAQWAIRQAHRKPKPSAIQSKSIVYERDPLVTAIALVRSQQKCEVAECEIPLFLSPEGVPFLEVHHIQPLAQGGTDTPDNVACLCPSHHREVHHGQNAAGLTFQLRTVRQGTACT
jgi:hypothetical protein